jgi:hypothetical protein
MLSDLSDEISGFAVITQRATYGIYKSLLSLVHLTLKLGIIDPPLAPTSSHCFTSGRARLPSVSCGVISQIGSRCLSMSWIRPCAQRGIVFVPGSEHEDIHEESLRGLEIRLRHSLDEGIGDRQESGNHLAAVRAQELSSLLAG